MCYFAGTHVMTTHCNPRMCYCYHWQRPIYGNCKLRLITPFPGRSFTFFWAYFWLVCCGLLKHVQHNYSLYCPRCLPDRSMYRRNLGCDSAPERSSTQSGQEGKTRCFNNGEGFLGHKTRQCAMQRFVCGVSGWPAAAKQWPAVCSVRTKHRGCVSKRQHMRACIGCTVQG